MTRCAVIAVVLLGACDHPDVELSGQGLEKGKAYTGPAWTTSIASIVQNNCIRCHRAGQLGTYRPYDTFIGARNRAPTIAVRVAGATRGYPQMPPYTPDATESCIPEHGYSNDLSLTQQEIDDIVLWAANGAPYGAMPFPAEPLAPAVIAPLSGATEYPFTEGLTVSIENISMKDDYYCVIHDPGTQDLDRLLGAVQVNPDVDHLVKGVQVYLDADRESLAYVGLASTRTHGANWYDCNDGLGFEGDVVASFLPGSFTPDGIAPGGVAAPPISLPAGSAMSVPGDALLVAKILYHPHWNNLDPWDTSEVVGALSWVDHTSISVKWEPESPPLVSATMLEIGNATELADDGTGLLTAPFEVPAGVLDVPAVPHVETMSGVVPGTSSDTYAVFSVLPTMGRQGTKIEVRSTSADETTQCLGAVSSWEYDFQGMAEYDDAVDGRPVVHGGDVITIDCTYENLTAKILTLDAGPLQERCAAAIGIVEIL
jgi:hypothetical protein